MELTHALIQKATCVHLPWVVIFDSMPVPINSGNGQKRVLDGLF
jgi:hypothetical protein